MCSSITSHRWNLNWMHAVFVFEYFFSRATASKYVVLCTGLKFNTNSFRFIFGLHHVCVCVFVNEYKYRSAKNMHTHFCLTIYFKDTYTRWHMPHTKQNFAQKIKKKNILKIQFNTKRIISYAHQCCCTAHTRKPMLGFMWEYEQNIQCSRFGSKH